jgi:Transposase and inactivated derivatives
MLDLLPGRKLEELRTYAQEHTDFLLLNPKSVVMDLAQTYHAWIRECFPKAIRIADRFHVHGYVIESVQEVRKTVQRTLSPRAKAYLKANHRLLNPPAESLSEESGKRLETLLSYSPLLRSVWEWKEAFSTWYDCSPALPLPNGDLIVGASKAIESTTPLSEARLRQCAIGKRRS